MSRRESMHKKSKYEWKRKHVEEEKVGVEDIACRRRKSTSRRESMQKKRKLTEEEKVRVEEKACRRRESTSRRESSPIPIAEAWFHPVSIKWIGI